MALPLYTRTREGEAPQLGRSPNPCRLGLCIRKCPHISIKEESSMLKLRQPLQTEVLRYSQFVRSLLAITVACMAIINGLSVLLPAQVGRLALLAILFNQLEPFAASIWPFIQAGRTIALILGFFLLLIAGGLARGKRRAWQCAIILVPLTALAHLARGLDVEETALAMILWFALLYCKPYFCIKSDPWRMRQGLLLLIVGGVLLVLYSLRIRQRIMV